MKFGGRRREHLGILVLMLEHKGVKRVLGKMIRTHFIADL
jgi:hypothetical protein